jgi:ribosomal protein S6E (S10)
MGAVEDVDAIYANAKLTPSQRAQNAASAKAVAWRSAILGSGVMPHTWTFTDANGSAWEVSLTRVMVDGGLIRLEGISTKNGVPVRQNLDGTSLWPICVYNPPLFLPDTNGNSIVNGRAMRADVIAVARAVVEQTIAQSEV